MYDIFSSHHNHGTPLGTGGYGRPGLIETAWNKAVLEFKGLSQTDAEGVTDIW